MGAPSNEVPVSMRYTYPSVLPKYDSSVPFVEPPRQATLTGFG